MKKGFIIFGSIAVAVLGVLATPVIYTAVKTPKIKKVEITQIDEKNESFSLQFDVDKKIDITKVFLSNNKNDSFTSLSALEKDSSFFSSSYVANFNIPLEEKDTFTISGFFNNKGEKISFGNKEKIEINYGKVFNLASVSINESFDFCDNTVNYDVKIDSPRKYSPEKLVYTFNGESGEKELEGKSPFSISFNSNDFIFDLKIQGIKYNSQENERFFETNFDLITNREDYKKSLIKDLTFPSGLFVEEEENFGKLEIEKNKYGSPQSVSVLQDGVSSTISVSNTQETPSSLFVSFETAAKTNLTIKSINYQNASYPVDSSFPLSPEHFINPNLFSFWGDKKIFKNVASNFNFSTGRSSQKISLSSLKINFLNKNNNETNSFDYDSSSFSNGKILITENNVSFKNFMDECIKINENLDSTFEVSLSNISLSYKNVNYDSLEVSRKIETKLSELSFIFKECSDNSPLTNFNNKNVTFTNANTPKTVELNFSLLSPYSLPSSTTFSLKYTETLVSSEGTVSTSPSLQNVSQNGQSSNFMRGLKTFEDGTVEYKINISLTIPENCIVFSFDLTKQTNAEAILYAGDSSKKIENLVSTSILETDFVEKNVSPFSQETNNDISLPATELAFYDKNSNLIESHVLQNGSFKNNDFCTIDDENTNKINFFLPKNVFSSINRNYGDKNGTVDGFNYTTKITNNKLSICFSFDSFNKIKNNFFNSDYFSKEIEIYSFSGYCYTFDLFVSFGENISSVSFHSSNDVLSLNLNISLLNSTSQIKIEKDSTYNNFINQFGSRVSPTSLIVSTIENKEVSFDFKYSSGNNIFFSSEEKNTYIGKITKINWEYTYKVSEETEIKRTLTNKISSSLDLKFLGEDFASDYVEMYRKVFYSDEHEWDIDEYWHTPLRLKTEKNSRYNEIFKNLFLQSLYRIEMSNGEVIFSNQSAAYNPVDMYGFKFFEDSNTQYEVVFGTIRISLLSTRTSLSKVIVSYYSRFADGGSTSITYNV